MRLTLVPEEISSVHVPQNTTKRCESDFVESYGIVMKKGKMLYFYEELPPML